MLKLRIIGTNLSVIVFCLLSFVSVMFSCAKVGSPTGGPRDSIAPKLIDGDPYIFTTNYDKPTFKGTLKFNEFIQLTDFDKQFFISPITERKAEVLVYGKKLKIRLRDSLHKNTTYVLTFGRSIGDYTEANPFVGNHIDNPEDAPPEGFQYVFSTGDVIDSLSISGSVLDAFDHSKKDKIWVMIYKNYNDSTPLLKKPDYIARTDTAGHFSINYISPGNYRIFAIEDLNNNYIFDQANEKIAYLKDIFTPSAELITITDTIKVQKQDSTASDSIVSKKATLFSPNNVRLYLFQEKNEKQFIKEAKRPEKHKLIFVMNNPLIKDSAELKLTNTKAQTEKWKLTEKSYNKDTVRYWLTDSTLTKTDTLGFSFSFLTTDSLNNLVLKTDTFMLKPPKKENKNKGNTSRRKNRHRGIKTKEQKKDKERDGYKLNLKYKLSSSSIDLNKNISISFEEPLKINDKEKISLSIKEDTIFKAVDFEYIKDSIYNRIHHIKTKWAENSEYKVEIIPFAFVNNYMQTNDSIIAKFKTKEKGSYGKIELNLNTEKMKTNAILQLLSKDEKKIKERMIIKPGKHKIEWLYVPEDKYKLKIIEDSNDNGKWDTGKYIKAIQPERVFYYKDIIKNKLNWTTKINWTIDAK